MECIVVSVDTSQDKYNENIDQIGIGNRYHTLKNGILEKDDKIYISLREIGGLLGMPVNWDYERNIGKISPNLKKVDIVTNQNIYKQKELCAVPDEKIACKIGKLVLENILEQQVEFESNDWRSELQVLYQRGELNRWYVYQNIYYKGSLYRGVNTVNGVYINKNTGEIQKIVLTMPDYNIIEELMEKIIDNYSFVL